MVVPQTAGQNRVRWDSFDWKFIDLLEDKDLGKGLRLYYYDGETAVAKRAAAAIVEEYEHLVGVFDFKPKERIPYILYDSHQELEQTNLFQIGEGTLGVTSPLDLRMTAAYWGDHRRFRHVSLHEMVHQFTIQKVNAIAGESKVSGTPLDAIPLWFIEGIAEFYSTPGGFSADDERWIRDLVANPAPERGWFLRDFFEDDIRSFAFTYKLGQARVVFLTETYGEDVPQKILEQSFRLRPSQGGGLFGLRGETREPVGFAQLVKQVTGDGPDRLGAKFNDWLKKRYYAQYLAAKQQPSDLREVEAVRGEPDFFVVSPDGKAIVYRSIEPVTGITSLVLVDPRDPGSAVRIARDGKLGVDSLHYFDRSVADIDEERIAWIARRGPNDVVRVGRWSHEVKDAERGGELRVSARLRTGSFRLFDPDDAGIRELGSPAFSPDGTKVAFVALDRDGVVDVWTLDLESAEWERVTNDIYAERDLDWGDAGIAFSSDATTTAVFNLFLLDPASREVRRLTASRSDHQYPRFIPGTDRLLYSGDEAGKWDVYEIDVTRAPIVIPPERELVSGDDLVPTAGVEGTDEARGRRRADMDVLPDPADTNPGEDADWTEHAAVLGTSSEQATGGDAQPQEDEAEDLDDGTDADYSPVFRRTDFSAGLTWPAAGGGRIYALALLGGRFRVYSLSQTDALAIVPSVPAEPPPLGEPWTVPSRALDGSLDYKPWNTGNWAMEQAFIALGAGNGIFGGGFLFFQDLFRDRTLVAQGQAFGDVSLTDLQVIYFDRTRRVPLGFGVIMSPTFVLDPEFSTPNRPIYFVERRIGAVGLAEYPFNRYMRVGTGLGVSATNRTIPEWLRNFASRQDRLAWEARNDGYAAQFDGSVHAGYDSLVWSWETGPLTGSSVLTAANVYYQPARDTWFGDALIDAQRYFRLGSTVALGLRATTGRAYGNEWRRPFYVYSVDNLRGVPWYEYDYLISDSYLVGQAELAVPLNRIIRIAIFNSVIGIAGVDAGSLFDRYQDAEANSTAAGVLGVNMRLAIFDLRLHFARPFDVGGLVPGETRGPDGTTIVPDGWVTNFSIRYAWF